MKIISTKISDATSFNEHLFNISNSKFYHITPHIRPWSDKLKSKMACVFDCQSVVFRFSECITGHRVYKDIWEPVIGETFTCDIHDPYAVKVTFQGVATILDIK